MSPPTTNPTPKTKHSTNLPQQPTTTKLINNLFRTISYIWLLRLFVALDYYWIIVVGGGGEENIGYKDVQQLWIGVGVAVAWLVVVMVISMG